MATEALRIRVVDAINQWVFDLASYRNKQADAGKPLANAYTQRVEGVIELLQQIRDEVWPEASPQGQHDAARYLPLLEQALQQLALDPEANGIQVGVQLKPGMGFHPVRVERLAPQVLEAQTARKQRIAQVRAEHEQRFGAFNWWNVSKQEQHYINTGRL